MPLSSKDTITAAEAVRLDAAAMSERDFRQQVLDLAILLGWKCYFTWSSIHSPSGFPDVFAVRRDRVLVAELKSEKGRLTDAQRAWLEALRATGRVEVFEWRPGALAQIAEVLA